MRTPLIRLGCLLSLLIAAPAPAVTMAWTPIGSPGNACDPNPDGDGGTGCYGAVGYAYSIGTYDVTNAQYAEFLNAKAGSDPSPNPAIPLWNPNMDPAYGGSITRNVSGFPYTYTYTVVAGRENMPVNHVAFYSAVRFANWMNNGQGSGDTETGAYTIPALVGAGWVLPRNAGATIVLPSEDEWYKAAYYDSSSLSYFDYAAGSDSQPTCSTPTATPNSANCGNAVGDLTAVGSYTGSAGPYGTFDQGGNVYQWTEGLFEHSNCSNSAPCRVIRGGYYGDGPLGAQHRDYFDPVDEDGRTGFRILMLPEPGTGPLVIAALLGLAACRRPTT